MRLRGTWVLFVSLLLVGTLGCGKTWSPEEKAAIAEIKKLGGTFKVSKYGKMRDQKWITRVSLDDTRVTDSGLEHLKGLSGLQYLYLDNTQVTDVGLEHLKELTRLRLLHLNDTQVTDAGVNELRKALPNCEIVR